MTPEEQRIALAGWAGWRKEFIHGNGLDADVWIEPTGNRCFLAEIDALPNYLNDLNAVHELEGKLTFEQAEQFEDELCDIVVKYNEHQENPAPWRFAAAHATAAQRCEALLKTLNLWKP